MKIKSGTIRPNNRRAPKSLRDLRDLDTLDVEEFEDERMEKLPQKHEYNPDIRRKRLHS